MNKSTMVEVSNKPTHRDASWSPIRHSASREFHTLPTKADAQAWLSGVETDIKRGTWLDPEGCLLYTSSPMQMSPSVSEVRHCPHKPIVPQPS